mmetsp:Transcript_7302/g.12325  ORF Transcript_7302/g.12325 Transcript_7302/m.12325 type:complete len:227 (+) Transcript_7302:1101-1781(+)
MEAVELYSVPKPQKTKRKGEESGDKASASEEKKQTGAGSVKAPQQLSLVNERGQPSGKFGWCIACRSTANLYCKHTRHPVCSFECKQRHIKLLEDAQAAAGDELTTARSIAQSNSSGQLQSMEEPHARDALLIFNKLCQLLHSKDLDGKIDSVYGVRKVLLVLDLIHSCLENPGATFVNRREFISVIRDQLCNALLKFAVSSEHQIFSKTVSIFYCLFIHFREHLK